MRNKIAAFTLIEQVIVLALTALLVLVGYVAFMNLHRLTNKVSAKAAMEREICQLFSVMNNDFIYSESVVWYNGLVIHKYTEEIRYIFSHKYLTRETENVIDTFNVDIIDSEQLLIEKGSSLIKSFTLKVNQGDKSYEFFFEKKYSEYQIWEMKKYGN